MKLSLCAAAVAVAAVAAEPTSGLRGGASSHSACEKLYNGTVIELQMISSQGSSYAQYGIVRKVCQVNVTGNMVEFGVEAANPKLPTIAATMLKTARAVDPSKVKASGNPSLVYCQAYGGAEAAFVSQNLRFTEVQGQSDQCVFGDGSMASAWSIAYLAMSTPGDGWRAIRDQISSEQVFLGVTAPGDIFVS
jgi:hypothetical protein